MYKLQETGRSMVEMLGVLAVIGILTMAAFVGYHKAVMKSRLNKTIETTASILQSYAELTLKNMRGTNIDGENSVQTAADIGLASGCQVVQSETDTTYQVCDVPLGEIYLKFKDYEGAFYSFMLFVTMLREGPDTCAEFLSQGWEQIIPKEWWNYTTIWLKSEQKEQIVFEQGLQSIKNRAQFASSCQAVCPEGNKYCSIIFDFASSY